MLVLALALALALVLVLVLVLGTMQKREKQSGGIVRTASVGSHWRTMYFTHSVTAV